MPPRPNRPQRTKVVSSPSISAVKPTTTTVADLAMKLIHSDPSVLIVPGDHFGIDHYLRISFGLNEDYLSKGLDAITKVLNQL